MSFDPAHYQIRTMNASDFPTIRDICKLVYPEDTPYTEEELAKHKELYPQGQFVAEHLATGNVAGVHFSLRISMNDYHIDDSWDVLTAHGTFEDHDPVNGHTLYGADVFVSPEHQHHGLAHALTDATRKLAVEEGLWRMVAGSRLPGYSTVVDEISPLKYVQEIVEGKRIDPVLTAHLKDGWSVVKPIQGYLAHDPESAGWAAVIQWINPDCPPPPGFELR